MSAKNSSNTYGLIAKSFHWLTALLIVSLIPLGVIANGLPYETSEELAQKAFLFSLHKTLGVTVFFVALARIVWAISQTKPDSLNPENRLEHALAETVHWLLYGSLVLVPLTGWIHHASTTGFAPIWWPFGQGLPFVAKDDGIAATFAGLHILFERVLLVSILLHVAGALKHHVIDKDATLRRMWFGTTDVKAPEQSHSFAWVPPVAALCVWGFALVLASMIGMFDKHTASAAPAAGLDAVASEWRVQSGEIRIGITQFGSSVSGSFEDWTAAITFDPDIKSGTAGTVETRIAIGSLTLGSVTSQAMGPDYFDAQTYETALFQATIQNVPDGYAAVGTLTIKDNAMPVTLPFGLSIQEDIAIMTGSTSVNRLDFGIGANMPDETSLAFAVDINIALTAQRSQNSE